MRLNSFFTRFFFLVFLTGNFVFSAANHPLWALTLAGTTINNRASGSYVDAETGFSSTLQSNTVAAEVQPQEAVLLAPNQSVQGPVGAPVNLSHRITNTGNVASKYNLTFANMGGDDFDLTGLRLVSDLNDNGIADSGEPEITTQTVSLDAGASLSIVIAGFTPGSAAPDTSANVKITATSVAQKEVSSNNDVVTITSALSLQVFKVASLPSAKSGQNVTFTLSALNRGGAAPAALPVNIDGVARHLILLHDEIPANTSLVSYENTGSGQVLYHRLGDDSQSYLSKAPSNLDSVDAIAYGVIRFLPQSTMKAEFTVQLHHNLSGDIHNTAQLLYAQPGATEPQSLDSNEVVVTAPIQVPTIEFYTNDSFTQLATAVDLSSPLHLELNSAWCNHDPLTIERITVTISSLKTGDMMTGEAVETGPNTGIFRIITASLKTSQTKNLGDKFIQTVASDSITASFVCNGTTVSDVILVDPLGVVYDSKTNQPIAGAKVTLIDVDGRGNGGHAGEPATVFNFDGTPAPNSVVTNAQGQFQFPRINESHYRLAIIAPTGYSYPSKVPAGLQPAGRVIDIAGSYGGIFNITISGGTVQIDVPMDAQVSQSGLFIEKTALRHQADIGDFVDFQIHVRNNTTAALTQTVVSDTLPGGFKFQNGSARLGGLVLNSTFSGGRNVSFNLGALAVGADATFTYRALIGPGTRLGKNVNRATATGSAANGTTTSNVAADSVDVEGGVFDDKAIIVGRVWVDLNRDGMVQENEPGIPGVRIFLEDGTFVITDEQGKYSIYGLDARTHVVKIDPTTLPSGVKMEALDSHYNNSGQSCMIDLKKGELHKVNFADQAATDATMAELKGRRDAATNGESEAALSLNNTLTPDGATITPGDVRGMPASGMIGSGGISGFQAGGSAFGTNSTFSSNPNAYSNTAVLGANAGENGGTGLAGSRNALPLGSGNSNLPPAPVQAAPSVDLETQLATLSSDLGFVDLKDGDTLPLAQANLRVKGTAGSTFKLTVNGTEVPDTRVGQKSSGETVTAWEYVGVKMVPGKNTLQVEQIDAFGIARGKASLSVIAPGDLDKLELTLPKGNLYADGKSVVTVDVRLTDANGATVSTRTPVTLEATSGQWQVTDLNPAEPGIQVFILGGHGQFSLLAPSQSGNCAVRVSSGILQSNAQLSFVPELRPLLVTGVATAKMNFGFNAKSASAVETSEIFENEDKARGALYVKGRILGSSLLTMRYDSQKPEDDRLFRDIQPDAYYPIYGDSSQRGFDAQSTGKLYVRVDQNKSYVLYGDYTTSSLNPARSLGDYNRSFNGLKLHHEDDKLTTNFYASRDNQRQVVDEIRGNGTSSGYLLRSGEIQEQSEKVEIIVRDRNQPSVVLSVKPQTRFLDYSMDGFSQGIIFRSPVPSVDADLNPISVRITYEVEQGGPKFTVAGGDAQYRVTQKLEVGGGYTTDKNPQAPFSLRSLNATYRFAPHTTLVGEWAQSKDGDKSGGAQRFELLHEGEKLTARLFWGRSDNGFDNPAALLTQGRQEATLKSTYKLNDSNRLVAEALHSKDTADGGVRNAAQLSLEHSFDNNVRVEVGIRKVKDNSTNLQSGPDAKPVDFTSLRAKVSAQVPNAPQANVFAEYEHAITGGGQVLSVGGDYQIANRGRLYVRHELLSSLSGRYGLNDTEDQHTTLVGMDTDYMKNGRAFSEYRVGGGIDGRDAEASIGLRNTWNLGEGLRANTTFERIKDLGGSSSGVNNDSVAVTGAVEYTRSPNFKGTARLEVRNGQSSDSILGTIGAAYKISDSLSLLGKGVINHVSSSAPVTAPTTPGIDLTGQNQHRAIMGLSYRSTKNDRLQALLKYEYRGEGGSIGSRLRRHSQVVSLNANYQASHRWNLSGHYAVKSGYDLSNGQTSRSLLQLLSGRATYNMGRRTDLSLLGNVFRADGTVQTGIGAELGFRLTNNLRLSGGYLLGHFHDNDLPDVGGTDSGFYLRFGYEFDEGLLEDVVK